MTVCMTRGVVSLKAFVKLLGCKGEFPSYSLGRFV